MPAYSTTATVEDHGSLHLQEVPFAPGTHVEVVIRETNTVDADRSSAASEPLVSVRELFTRLRGRNTQPVGPLRREDLYDRRVLR